MFCSPGPCRSVILTTGKLVPSEWFTIFRPFVYIVYAVQNKKREKKTNTIFNGFFTLSLSILSVMPISFSHNVSALYIYGVDTPKKRAKKKVPPKTTRSESVYLAKIWTKCDAIFAYIVIRYYYCVIFKWPNWLIWLEPQYIFRCIDHVKLNIICHRTTFLKWFNRGVKKNCLKRLNICNAHTKENEFPSAACWLKSC